MPGFDPLLDTLPPAQRALWPQLGASIQLGLVLYGGTAIALQLGHRASVDFDFFTDLPLDTTRIRASFAFAESATVLQDSINTLTLLVESTSAESDPVNVSFFGGIGIGRVGVPRQSNDNTLIAASLVDLMAIKLKVLLQRIEAKDYLDIAAMIDAGVSLPMGLAAAKVMYGSAFQPSEALKALTYFDGGDLDALPDATRSTLIVAARMVGELPEVRLSSRDLSISVPP